MFLKDIWPTSHEIAAVMPFATRPGDLPQLYGNLANANPLWGTIDGATGQVYDWPRSTYIAKPPFFDGFKMTPRHDRATSGRARARHLRRLGHHRPHLPRPARSSRPRPRAMYLLEHDVSVKATSTATARAAATTR